MLTLKRASILGLIITLLSLTVHAEDARKRLYLTEPEPAHTQDDIEAEILFGRELASKVLGRYPASNNKKINEYLNKVGQSLAQKASRTELTYHFIVLDTPIINAFAAPGGYIFVTQGAIDKMRDESELAAVIGHEFGHIEDRHYVKKIGLRSNKGSLESGLVSILAGGGNSASKAFNQAVNETMEVLFETGLQSVKEEYQADEHAVWLLAHTGYDPTALLRYFKRIQQIQNPNMQTLNQTHPPIAERISALETLIKEYQLDQLNYATLQERFNEHK